jgi:hypothetical protein
MILSVRVEIGRSHRGELAALHTISTRATPVQAVISNTAAKTVPARIADRAGDNPLDLGLHKGQPHSRPEKDGPRSSPPDRSTYAGENGTGPHGLPDNW